MNDANKACVNAGVLMMPLSGVVVTAQQQQDVVNSLLFAQLSARRTFPQSQQHNEREQAVQSMLDNLGWIRLSEPRVVFTSAHTLTVAAVMAAESKSMFEPRVGAGFSELITALKVIPSKEAQRVWREQTVSPLDGEQPKTTVYPEPDEFDVCVRLAIIDADSVFHMLMLNFSTRTVLVDNYLSQEVVTDAKYNLRVQGYTYELNKQGFANVRTTVDEKLADKIKRYVMPWACASSCSQPSIVPSSGR